MHQQDKSFELHGRGYAIGEILSPLLWMALGAGLMYLLDPRGGGRRRAFIRDKMIRATHQAGDTVRDAAAYTRDHVRGYAAEARARMTEGPVPDEILAERVRSQMGRPTTHPGAIQVNASQGIVTLRGPILAGEVDNLMRSVRGVRGVCHVENQLDVRESAENEPSLQGQGSRQSRG
jgi:hypothetical protein